MADPICGLPDRFSDPSHSQPEWEWSSSWFFCDHCMWAGESFRTLTQSDLQFSSSGWCTALYSPPAGSFSHEATCICAREHPKSFEIHQSQKWAQVNDFNVHTLAVFLHVTITYVITFLPLTEEDVDDETPCPNFSNYLYFLFAPTLVYRDNYPRSVPHLFHHSYSKFQWWIIPLQDTWSYSMGLCLLQLCSSGGLPLLYLLHLWALLCSRLP